MFEVKIDESDFARVTRQMDAAYGQMPYAMSRALNDAADEAYQSLIDHTWPSSVTVRNASFLRWALRTKFSTKDDLRVEIYDTTPDNRARLQMHAKGGTKLPRAKALAIPTSNVRRSGSGVASDQRPANLKNKVVKGGLIFQAYGRGKQKKLRLMYTLHPSATQPKDVPFYEDFEEIMRESSAKHFPVRMMQAMLSAR
jgi:hypothetical protein